MSTDNPKILKVSDGIFKFWFVEQRHYVRTHPVRKVLRSFFKSDPPVILRPQACGALFGSFSRASSFERKNAMVKTNFSQKHTIIATAWRLPVFLCKKRRRRKEVVLRTTSLSKRNAGRCGAGRSLFEKSSAKTFIAGCVRTQCPSPTNQNLKF